MKIVHICQYYQEGLGYQENLLPLYQKKLGHDVVIVTSDRVLPPFRRLKGQIRSDRGANQHNEVPVIRLQTVSEFKNRFVVFKNLIQVLEAERPDYIFHHGVTAPSLITATRYKRKHKSTFLAVDNHSDLNISARCWLWRKVYYEFFWSNLLKNVWDYVDVAFGVTPARCLFMEKYLKVPRDKIRLLPIGVDVESAERVLNLQMESIRREFGVSEKGFVIASGGKITKAKGYLRLLRAFKMLAEEHDNVFLVLFGKVLDKDLERDILGDSKIYFLGWQDRLNTLKILRISDVAIWPGIHTTLIEDAIAVLTPLILRYYGSTCHHIIGNGVFLYEGSAREIYDKLSFLIKYAHILEDMREKTWLVRKILSYDNIAKESIEYARDLAPKRAHRVLMQRRLCDENYCHFEKVEMV